MDGRQRAVIEGITPQVDGGRFPIKRTVGDKIVVRASVFVDGHDVLMAMLRYRKEGGNWQEQRLRPLPNDKWQGEFVVTELGRYEYTVSAWVDNFLTWRHDFKRRVNIEDISLALRLGSALLDTAAANAPADDAQQLKKWSELLVSNKPLEDRQRAALSDELAALMLRYPDRRLEICYEKIFTVVVDTHLARFGAWYEFFPRSCGNTPERHGTFKDCLSRLRYVAEMGFDIVYLPPIHPIGYTKRKGKNNALFATTSDPGSPWAIGAPEGGHKSVHPALGTLDDFRHLVVEARNLGIEIALDIAFQCSPDHPYVKEHPDWFRWRPDGSVQYAENPPKKYEDIYPFNFETETWHPLWDELKSVFVFWIGQGVNVFRVDNPHTKPFALWEWLITEVKREHPQIIFLAEAFSRPKIMHRLAKLGFSQSYTYFSWRNTKGELTDYFTELSQSPGSDYFRGNLWPNTPDILPEYLQYGGRPAFMVRLVLAATLGASYGIYGPAFELCEGRAREFGSEEYLDSEKYQLRYWSIDRPDSLKDFIGRVNRIRKENAALHYDGNINFYQVDNDYLFSYTKRSPDGSNIILVVINLDPHHTQSGWVTFPLDEDGLASQEVYQVHELLTGARYLWRGNRNFVQLNPQVVPVHIFRIRKRIRSERDFEYFM